MSVKPFASFSLVFFSLFVGAASIYCCFSLSRFNIFFSDVGVTCVSFSFAAATSVEFNVFVIRSSYKWEGRTRRPSVSP